MENIMLIFVTAFILQFVGHHIGDYLLQTNTQAKKKSSDLLSLLTHCLIYSATISLVFLTFFSPATSLVVFAITLIEHSIVDSRRPVVGWKLFLERKIAGDKDFTIGDLPFFVLINIDQTFHLVRIFVISLLVAYGLI